MTSQFDLDAHLTSPLRIVGDEAVVSPAPVVVLLSCYVTGSTEGRNLGIAGYSHDFVAKAFAPLLARYGEVRAVVDPRRNLQQEVDRLIFAQRRPVHFSVLPLQDVVLGERVANIAVPAWEFPDAQRGLRRQSAEPMGGDGGPLLPRARQRPVHQGRPGGIGHDNRDRHRARRGGRLVFHGSGMEPRTCCHARMSRLQVWARQQSPCRRQ